MSDIGELRIVVSVLNEASAELKKLDTDLNAVRAQTQRLQTETVKTQKGTRDLVTEFKNLATATGRSKDEVALLTKEFAKLDPVKQSASFGTFARTMKSEITDSVRAAGEKIGVEFPQSIEKTKNPIETFLGNMTKMRWALVNAFLVLNLGKMIWDGLIGPAVEYEMTMARIAVVTNTSLATSFETIDSLRKGTIFSLDEIAEAYLDVTKRGFDKAESDKIMATSIKLATFAQTDLITATDIATTVLNQYGMSANNVADIADKLTYADINSAASLQSMYEALKYAGPGAYAAGVSLEELLATIALLSDAGIRGEMAGTAIRGMLAAITNESPKAREQMEQLGITIFDAQGNFVGLNNVFTQLAIALGQGTVQEKTEAISEIFERRVATSVALATEKIILHTDAISSMTEGLETAGGSLEKFSTQMDTNSKKIKDFHESVGAKAREWGSFLKDWYAEMIPDEGEGPASIMNVFYGLYEAIAMRVKGEDELASTMATTNGQSIAYIKNNDDLFVSQMAVNIANNKATNSLKDIVSWTEKGNPSLITRTNVINEEAEAQKSSVNAIFNSIDARIRDTETLKQQLTVIENVKNAKVSIIEIEDQIKLKQEELKATNDKWNDSLRTNASNLRDVRSSLEDYSRVASDAQKNISTLASQRFTGETVILGLLDKVDIWMKKQKLLELGIADAGAFIQSQLSRVGDSFEDLIANQETVIENSEDSADAYAAWKTTIETAIKAEVAAGESLNADVTDRVRTWQTALLGIQNLEMQGADTGGQSSFVNKLQLAYDVYYGDMHNNVKTFMMEEEDKTNQITVNSSQVIELLKIEMAAYASASAEVVKLRAEEASLEQERKDYEAKKEKEVSKIEKDIKNKEYEQKKSEDVLKNIIESNTGVEYNNQPGPGLLRENNTVPYFNPWEIIANQSRNQPVSYLSPVEMANGGVVNKPTRAMIGEKGPEAVIPLSKLGKMGNNINVTVNVSGSNVSANEIARQIRKELQSY